VVRSVKGDGGSRPSEKGGCGWLGHIDLVAHELLAVLGVINCRSTKDHEVDRCLQEGALLLPSIVYRGVRLLLLIPPIGTPRQEPLYEGKILVRVLDGLGMVQAWSLK
jgi:hypothetical protein